MKIKHTLMIGVIGLVMGMVSISHQNHVSADSHSTIQSRTQQVKFAGGRAGGRGTRG